MVKTYERIKRVFYEINIKRGKLELVRLNLKYIHPNYKY